MDGVGASPSPEASRAARAAVVNVQAPCGSLEGTPSSKTSTASLAQRLLAAKRDLRLPQLIAQLDRYAWVVLDDIGYVQHGRDESD